MVMAGTYGKHNSGTIPLFFPIHSRMTAGAEIAWWLFYFWVMKNNLVKRTWHLAQGTAEQQVAEINF